MHASLCVPNGKALLSLLIVLVAKGNNKSNAYMKLDEKTTQALRDWHAVLKVALAHPTPRTDLVPADPDYGSYCDASKTGAGGVWFGIKKRLPPIFMVYHILTLHSTSSCIRVKPNRMALKF